MGVRESPRYARTPTLFFHRLQACSSKPVGFLLPVGALCYDVSVPMNKNQNVSKPSLRMFALLAGALVVVFLFSLSWGSTHIPWAALLRDLSRGGSESDNPWAEILFNIRLPRVILAGLVGAALATSGACLQGVFRNPMADPYILGVSAGGAVGATVAMAFGLHSRLPIVDPLPLCASLGALGTAGTVYVLSLRGGRIQTTTLLLTGLALSALLSAVMSFIVVMSVAEDLAKSVYFWLLGGFYRAGWKEVWQVLPYVLPGFAIIWYFARELNAMVLGEETALSVGVEVERVKKWLIVGAALCCAASVSVAGIIGFVGLIAPHVVRLLIGPDHRALVPASAVFGAIFLMGCDSLARGIVPQTEIPVGILTSFLGVPFFLYLLRTTRQVFF